MAMAYTHKSAGEHSLLSRSARAVTDQCDGRLEGASPAQKVE